MAEDHSGSAPLLTSYSNGGENKSNVESVSERSGSARLPQVVEEIKELYTLALPVIFAGLLTYGKSGISMHFLGKIGKEGLAGGSLAIGMANITGYSLISGLAQGMEGISSQAYGARKWKLVGEALQCTSTILIITCIPLSALWLNFEPILLACRQDPTISSIAATYLAYSIPDLLFQCLLNPLRIFLRTQGVTRPLMYGAGFALIVHASMSYVVIHTFGLGIEGIALVGAFTNLNFMIFLVLYTWFTGACSQCWQGLSWQCYSHWRPILAQGAPSCFSVCLEWWWYELLVIFSGLLENATENLSTYGIVIQATSLMYNFPYALGMALSTKVGNELGANRPNKAKTSSYTALMCSCFTSIVALLLMVTTSHVWGLLFTHDEGVLSLLSKTLPIVGLCELGNCPQTTICGMLTGSARPALGAKINLFAFYVVGLPVGLLLCFVFHLGLMGLFLGLLAAQIVCAFLMVVVLTRTDWNEQANRSKKLTGGISETNAENSALIEGAASV